MYFMSTASLAKLAKLYNTFRYRFLEGNPGANENDCEAAFLQMVEKGDTADVGRPRYTHDCDKCVFLGHYDQNEQKRDLYFCLQTGNLPTVIARFGNEGYSYGSGLFNTGEDTALGTAEKLARMKGLLK